MNRRSFLRSRRVVEPLSPPPTQRHRRGDFGSINGRPPGSFTHSLSANGDLTPYVDRAEKPWNVRRVGHLLRRAGFGYSWQELDLSSKTTPQAIVELLLASKPLPQAPGSWAQQDPLYPVDNAARAQYNIWLRQLQEWWVAQMLTPGNMLREKMTLFWHNHFVSDYPTVYVTQYLYNQNQLFRQLAFGNFKELTKKVTIDCAMLVYLDGALSRNGNPNENYARELLELFTLGVGTYADGSPHYTERDIIELARALTGWTIPQKGLTSVFVPARFDNGQKTLLGKTANFGIEGKAAEDVIDHIFSIVDKDHGISRAAIFLCEKLYQTFVNHTPDMEVVKEMAKTLVANDWSVGAVLRQLLTSEHFFDENIIGSLIKSPADFVIGSIHSLNLQAPMNAANLATDRPETHDPVTAMWYLSQWIFYPPNVKGWPGGRTWISSVTLPLRIRYSKMWVEPVPNSLAYNFDPVGFITSLPDAESVQKVLDHLIELLLPIEVSKETRDSLLAELLGGGFEYEWKPEQASQKIRSCLVKLSNLAEYQLL